MAKRALLSSAISAAAHGKLPVTTPATPPAPPPEEAPLPVAAREPAAGRAPSRQGKKAVYSWVEPNVHRSLRSMNLDTGRSVDELVGEAVRTMLKQHGYLK